MAENKTTPFSTSHLRGRFSDFVSRQWAISDTLLGAMKERGWQAFAFGGTPRGVVARGAHYQPRDLDLVFDDAHFTEFARLFHHCIRRRNRFGGLQLRIDHAMVDAWPLSSTWAFKEGLVRDISFPNLPRTTFLNVDGLVIEFTSRAGQKRELHEAGFQHAWDSRLLDINLRDNPYPALCVVRTLQLARQFRLRIARPLTFYLYDQFQTLGEAELRETQRAHYGFEVFSHGALRTLRQQVEQQCERAPLFPLDLFPGQMRLRFGRRHDLPLGSVAAFSVESEE